MYNERLMGSFHINSAGSFEPHSSEATQTISPLLAATRRLRSGTELYAAGQNFTPTTYDELGYLSAQATRANMVEDRVRLAEVGTVSSFTSTGAALEAATKKHLAARGVARVEQRNIMPRHAARTNARQGTVYGGKHTAKEDPQETGTTALTMPHSEASASETQAITPEKVIPLDVLFPKDGPVEQTGKRRIARRIAIGVGTLAASGLITGAFAAYYGLKDFI